MNNSFLHNPQFPGEAFCLEAPGPTAILLFHGFTATVYEVEHLGKTLHQAGYSTVGPMLPGHGTRPEDLNRVVWQDWAGTAEAVYSDLSKRYQHVIVGGESNGGLLALYMAEQHPEIPAVLAFAPALILPLGALQRLQLRLIAPFVPAIPKNDLSTNTTWQGYKVNPPKAVLQHIRLQEVVREQLAKIISPILIVQGRNDRTIDPRGAELLYQQVSSKVKRMHWMENSGHCVLLEAERNAVETLALDFLRELGL